MANIIRVVKTVDGSLYDSVLMMRDVGRALTRPRFYTSELTDFTMYRTKGYHSQGWCVYNPKYIKGSQLS